LIGIIGYLRLGAWCQREPAPGRLRSAVAGAGPRDPRSVPDEHLPEWIARWVSKTPPPPRVVAFVHAQFNQLLLIVRNGSAWFARQSPQLFTLLESQEQTCVLQLLRR